MCTYNFKLRHRDESDSNLLNPQTLRVGYIWRSDAEEVNSNYSYSELIEVSPSTDYQGRGFTSDNIFYSVDYYDADKYYVSSFGTAHFDNFTTPSGVYYVRVTVKSEVDPFLLSVSEGLASEYSPYFRTRDVYPRYPKLERKYELESLQAFYRQKIASSLILQRSDYEYVDSLDFQQQIFMVISDPENFFDDFIGEFYKTDCKWDADNQKVEIKLDTADDYTPILSGLDKTFNLIQEEPALEEVLLRRRPIIQVYIPGDKVVTNILGGSYWETEIQVDPVFDLSVLVNTYYFYNTQNIRSISTGYASVLSTDVTGEYDTNGDRVSGSYKLVTETDTTYFSFIRYRYHIVESSASLSGIEVWDQYALYSTGWSDWRDTSINTLLFRGVNGETGNFYFADYRIYARYYTDLLDLRGSSTYAVPSVDIIPNNANYKRVIGLNVTDKFSVYNEFSDNPTKYGRVPGDAPNAEQYYKELIVSVITGLSNPVPVAPSAWRSVSLWFFTDIALRYTEFIDGMDVPLKDSIPLHSVIQVLLRACGSSVTFSNTSEYSQFLYDTTNPLGGFSYLDFDGGSLSSDYAGNLSFFLTPKSNILVGDYDQPAQKAEISLGQVLNMLRDTMRVFWHVENGRLRIEHISWYQRGGSYTSNVVGTDLTQLINPKTNKNWSFNQNKWEFNKEEMPERFEYGWMDDVSSAFEGYPIEIVSKHVQQGQIDERTVNGISTDIDYLVANPNEVSKDGFVLLGAVSDEAYYFDLGGSVDNVNDLDAEYVKADTAFRFTGTQKITVPCSQDSTTGFTILVQCKLESFTGSETILASSDGFNPATNGFRLVATTVSGTKRIALQMVNSSYVISKAISDSVIDNVWVDIAVRVNNNNSNKVNIRVNGVNIGLYSGGPNTVPNLTSSRPVVLGNVNNSGVYDRPLIGSIRRVTIFNEHISVTDLNAWSADTLDVSTAALNLDFRKSRARYRIPYTEHNLGYNSEVILQNGLMSWLYLHPKFHTYDLPADRVRLNNAETVLASNITKKKNQKINYPATGNIDPYKLVQTALGAGMIKDLTVDMSTRMIKANIQHDTE